MSYWKYFSHITVEILTNTPETDVIRYVNDRFRLRHFHDNKVYVAVGVPFFVVSGHNDD